MATRRREAFPGKEKATPSPKAGTAKLRAAVNQVSKPKVSTPPQKQTRPASVSRTPAAEVSKPQTRKPASPATATKPAQTRTRSLDNKTATPTQKTRVVAAAATPATTTGAARRATSLPVKAVAAPKPAPVAKKWKPVEKEEGKRRLSSSSAGSGRRSSTGLKKESGHSAPAAKIQPITGINLDKNEDLSMYSVPEPEMQLRDIDSYLAEAEEKTVQSLSDFEKGMDDFVRGGDQEQLNYAKIENLVNHADPAVVIAGSSTVSGPVVIKTQKLDSSSKQELEQDTNETHNSDKVEQISDNSHQEAREKEVKVVEVAAEEHAVESKEIEPAAEKKQENSVPQKQQEKLHGKYDSPVSNDVIEETANKLREMRKNKVRALAGAFETVISLQDK